MKTVIAGNGAFGGAMRYVLEQNENNVTIARRGEKIEAEVLVLCVPAASIRDVLPLVTFPTETKIIVNTAKGIEASTHYFPYQIVHEFYKETVTYYSLMGPSFSNEILADMPTRVNLGYKTMSAHNAIIKKMFETDTFRLKLTQGYEVLEIASAMKNVYAIGCGIADALGYGENTKVTMIALAIEEMQQYFCSLTYNLCMEATGSMIGDLILTCSSKESRNFQFGALLVNHTAQQARRMINSTVEGYTTITSLEYFQANTQIPLRFANFIAGMVRSNEKDRKKEFDDFCKRM